jgi:hypothetical protein
MNIDKAKVITVLRARGQDARADWLDREFPDLIDTYKNGALLRMLDIDPDAIAPAEANAR